MLVGRDRAVVAVEELRQLPLRAVVALAVRAAQRLLARPEFAGRQETPALDEAAAALQPAVDLALGATLNADATGRASAALRAANRARGPAGLAALTAGLAAGAAVLAAEGAAEALTRAGYALQLGGAHAVAAREDFRRLLDLQLGSFPHLGQPVDPSEAGPLGTLWD